MDAALALVDEGGVAAVSVERLAARAGVGKPTIYRSWPNAHAVLMAALIDAVEPSLPPDRWPSALEALRHHLHRVGDFFSTRLGRTVIRVVALAGAESELLAAFRGHFFAAARAAGRELLSSAVRRGEVRRDLDIDVTLDLLYAPIWLRVLMGEGSAHPRFVDALLRQALEGCAPRPAGGEGHLRRPR